MRHASLVAAIGCTLLAVGGCSAGPAEVPPDSKPQSDSASATPAVTAASPEAEPVAASAPEEASGTPAGMVESFDLVCLEAASVGGSLGSSVELERLESEGVSVCYYTATEGSAWLFYGQYGPGVRDFDAMAELEVTGDYALQDEPRLTSPAFAVAGATNGFERVCHSYGVNIMAFGESEASSGAPCEAVVSVLHAAAQASGVAP